MCFIENIHIWEYDDMFLLCDDLDGFSAINQIDHSSYDLISTEYLLLFWKH